MRYSNLYSIVAMTLLPAALFGAPNIDTVGRLIEQLGSTRFAERQSASKELLQLGEDILPRLRQTIEEHKDAEVRERSRDLVKKISDRCFGAFTRFQHPGGRAFAATITPDGQSIVTGGEDKAIRIWDLNGKQTKQIEGHGSGLNGAAFCPKGDVLATSDQGGMLILWNTAKWEKIRTLTGHNGEIYDIAWTSDGKQIITGCSDNSIRVWNVEDGKEVLKIDTPGTWSRSTGLSADDKHILAGMWDHTARVYDLKTGKERVTTRIHQYIMSTITSNQSGTEVLSSCGDGVIRRWDVLTGKEIQKLTGHQGYVFCARYSPDYKRAVSGGADKIIRLWDMKSGTLMHEYKDGHDEPIFRVQIAPKNQFLMSSDLQGRVVLWRLPKS